MKPVFKHSLIACALAQAFSVHAQSADPAPVTSAPATSAPVASVRVTGSNWLVSDRASIGGFADLPLMDIPASVVAIGRSQMQDLSIRSASDAAQYDASVGDAYNAVGYAEQFSVRGLKLNKYSGYRKDGIAIAGDTQIPLEN